MASSNKKQNNNNFRLYKETKYLLITCKVPLVFCSISRTSDNLPTFTLVKCVSTSLIAPILEIQSMIKIFHDKYLQARLSHYFCSQVIFFPIAILIGYQFDVHIYVTLHLLFSKHILHTINYQLKKKFFGY